jgi:benzil reductase ((S)-benzoin forming)
MRAAIVTGVSYGLGEAIAAQLLGKGYRVLGVSRGTSRRLEGERYRHVSIDLSDVEHIEDQLAEPFRQLADAKPTAVVLVNNAATSGPTGILGKLDARAIASSLAVNLAAPTILSNLFARTFAGARIDRRILNISSGAAQSTFVGGTVYGVAKAGLEMLSRSQAAEGDAIAVISVRPGIIDTPMQAQARSHTPEEMPAVQMFKDFHASGQLVPPHAVAAKIIAKLVEGPIKSGEMYRYQEL